MRPSKRCCAASADRAHLPRIFDNPEFSGAIDRRRDEKVIDSLTKRHFSRDSFLKDLDPFYKAIEETARTPAITRKAGVSQSRL